MDDLDAEMEPFDVLGDAESLEGFPARSATAGD